MINFIAEIGINYAFGKNKDDFLNNIKRLIDLANLANCKYVKFQKRNPDIAVPEEQKNKTKIVPWRSEPTTYLQYKKDVELSKEDFTKIYKYCEKRNLICFASVWDKDSVDFMSEFTNMVKIPSAHCSNYELLEYCKNKFSKKLLSTGMSTEEEIEKAIEIFNPDIIFHTNSAYPSPIEELNLNYILHLKEKYPDKIIGYSGHEYGLSGTLLAVALGAKIIERHITLDHNLWGSDQKSSVEPRGLFELKDKIKETSQMLGEKKPRIIFESEKSKRKSLKG